MATTRREELVERARELFSRHGFRAVGIDRILTEAGVAKMTLYNHFKSKDDLVVAALKRHDEIFRDRIAREVAARGRTPRERLLAVFGFLSEWFVSDEFHGCMFINAAAEFEDASSPVRGAAAENKRFVRETLRALAAEAGARDPGSLADQLALLIDGAIVQAHVVGQTGAGGCCPSDAARSARAAAETLVGAAL